jgi:hypothetical protein
MDNRETMKCKLRSAKTFASFRGANENFMAKNAVRNNEAHRTRMEWKAIVQCVRVR